ncbi:MAG: WecB/TagA/CpsF family glycosyltransferase [Azonexus sp.]|nr:WecB/TagA/CpsF family glycosyltransferase [Azonexus sp.]
MPDIGKDSDFTRVEDRREGQEAHGKAVEKFMTTAPRVDQVISLQTKMRLAWTFSPPFKAEYSEAELTAMIDAINATAPDVLWVGLTAPKQEKWIHQNRARLNVGFAGAIDAVFDFYTGRIKRSHPVFQKLGLEWLPRLLQ